MMDVQGSERRTGGFRLTPQLLFGMLVITVGVLLTPDNFGIADASYFVHYWPLALIAIGMLKLWQARDGLGGAFAGLLFTIAGVWLLLEELAVIRIPIQDLWPLLLVFFGAYLVWQGMSSRQRHSRTGVDGTSTISAVAILGGVARGNNSKHFQGADLTAILGGCEIDLRQAAINGDAIVDVFALWGGIDIRVPEDWTVQSRVVPLLGGVDDKTRPPQGIATHRLTLRGFAIMGGVEIKN